MKPRPLGGYRPAATFCLAAALLLLSQASSLSVVPGYVWVTVDSAAWRAGGCEGVSASSPSPSEMPVMRHKCDRITVDARGVNYYYEAGCTNQAHQPATRSYVEPVPKGRHPLNAAPDGSRGDLWRLNFRAKRQKSLL
jgi:hypothetical protein